MLFVAPISTSAGARGLRTRNVRNEPYRCTMANTTPVRSVVERGPNGKRSAAFGIDSSGWSRGAKSADLAYEGRRPRTWIRITKAGRRALAQEIALLKDLIGRLDAGVAAAPTDE